MEGRALGKEAGKNGKGQERVERDGRKGGEGQREGKVAPFVKS